MVAVILYSSFVSKLTIRLKSFLRMVFWNKLDKYVFDENNLKKKLFSLLDKSLRLKQRFFFKTKKLIMF